MKLAFVDLCGFRGYRKPVRIDFADQFTIIDGRNGVGKSTIFDAIEFALTGALGKYDDATAAGETVADYLWWTGEGPAPERRYVEVGFRGGEDEISIRRTQIGAPDVETLARVTARLCNLDLAPGTPLGQLCTTAIIRDERITALSLDLKETDRYALLRDALGANDSEVWISRGAQLVALAKRRTAAAQQDVVAANAEVAATARRIDEVRANLVAEAVMGQTVSRLRAFADTQVSPDQLANPVRQRIAAVSAEVEALESLSDRWSSVEGTRARLTDLSDAVASANAERDSAAAALQEAATTHAPESASTLAAAARDLIGLATLGRHIGLRDGHCPLCGAGQSHEEYERGIAAAEGIARSLDEQAARVAAHEQAQRVLEARLANAKRPPRLASRLD